MPRLVEQLYIWTKSFCDLADYPGLLISLENLAILIFFIGFLLCFSGFNIYRVVFSGMLFISVVTTWCLLWKETADWGNLVAGFSVCGCVMAFLGYRWVNMGAVILPTLFTGVLMCLWDLDLRVIIVSVIVMAFIAYGLPALTIKITTAGVGALLMVDAMRCYMGETNLNLQQPIMWVIAIGIIGLIVQLVTNQAQTIMLETKRGWAKKLDYKLHHKEGSYS